MGKRYLIAVDLEGAACVVDTPFTSLNGSSNYAFACRQATREADAAARALFDGGAEEVIVWDNHGQGVNLDYEQLDSRCRILLGTGYRSRFPLPEGRYDGLILIGYHGREGTPGGVLAHSYNSVSFQGHTVNGAPLGEMQIDAAFAGKRGVPVLFAASDDQAIAQARESFPWIETVVTKQASAGQTRLPPPSSMTGPAAPFLPQMPIRGRAGWISWRIYLTECLIPTHPTAPQLHSRGAFLIRLWRFLSIGAAGRHGAGRHGARRHGKRRHGKRRSQAEYPRRYGRRTSAEGAAAGLPAGRTRAGTCRQTIRATKKAEVSLCFLICLYRLILRKTHSAPSCHRG